MHESRFQLKYSKVNGKYELFLANIKLSDELWAWLSFLMNFEHDWAFFKADLELFLQTFKFSINFEIFDKIWVFLLS